MSKKLVMGIDLGTTNSEVAIIKEGLPKLLKIDGKIIVPSVVSFNEKGEVTVGSESRNQALVNPEGTVSFIKRKMGKDQILNFFGKDYTPPMISSFILKKLKNGVEELLSEKVTHAVITVPAFFDERQRAATKEAAELAGLEVLRLLNEPTAAALCYAMGNPSKELSLIYDLGGGTFDVSIVDLSSDVMEVKASHGDVELGGADFDRLIFEKAKENILKERGLDIEEIPSAYERLFQACERAKITLSTEPVANISEEFLYSVDGVDQHFSMQVTRAEFEQMIRPSLEKTLNSVREALVQAHCTPEVIDRVILVGGSTLIPLVSQMLQKELGIAPQSTIDPIRVVAQGAAIEAANLSGQRLGALMIDITPHSLGVGTSGLMGPDHSILIQRNSSLPAVASQVFYKAVSETNMLNIRAYQGESHWVADCELIGNFELTDLSSFGKDEILVKFELDCSGLLTVTATEIASGKSQSKVMKRIKEIANTQENLANLKSIKLVAEELPVEIFDEDKTFESIEKVEITKELTKKIKNLLADDFLDEEDKKDLQLQYEEALQGDVESHKKLEELVYYME